MVSASDKRGKHLPSLITPVMTLLFCVGVIAAWWAAERVMASDVDSGSTGEVSIPARLAPLLGGDVDSEIGDMVFLNDVRLEAGPGPQLFFVSGAMGTRMLVRVDTASEPRPATPMTVDIKGVLCRLPGPAILRRGWKLTRDQIQVFGQQQIYIAAEYVKGQRVGTRAD